MELKGGSGGEAGLWPGRKSASERGRERAQCKGEVFRACDMETKRVAKAEGGKQCVRYLRWRWAARIGNERVSYARNGKVCVWRKPSTSGQRPS